MDSSRTLRSVVCWELMVKNNKFPRVELLHQRFKPKLDEFKQDMSRVHASSREIDSLLFEPLQKSKVYAFATEKQTMDNFFKQQNFEKEFLSEHSDAKSLQRAMCNDCKDGLLVIPIYLVSEEDLRHGQIDIGEFESNLSENYRKSIKDNALIMLMFPIRTKEDMQFNIKRVIEIDPSLQGECKGSRIFHLVDHLFVEMVSRKIENWMFDHLRTTLDSLLAFIVLVDTNAKQRIQAVLENVSGIVITFDKFEYDNWPRQTSPKDMRGSTENTEDQQANGFLTHVVEIIGNETIHSIFKWETNKREQECNVYGPFGKCKSVITKHVCIYFESFILGLLWGLIGRQNLDLSKISPKSWWENYVGELVNNVSHGEISDEILRETEQLALSTDILKIWKPELEKLIEGNPLKDDIPYEAHISLSRVPGVKAFGILNEAFTVSVDEETLKNNCQVLMDVKEAVGKYFKVDDSTLKSWRKPIFHSSCGASIKGKNTGRISIFTELYGTDKKLDDLYFLTSKHVAPNRGIEVYLETCSDCNTKYCECAKTLLGINRYPFGPEKKNIFGAYVDITCGQVASGITPKCERDIRGRYSKLIQIAPLPDSVKNHEGEEVLKWKTDLNPQYGRYEGFQCLELNENTGFQRFDIITSTDESFGSPGESGALMFLRRVRENDSDILYPTFVYCGQWDGKYICFQLQQGLECLQTEYALNFCLCYENPKDRPSTHVSARLKRKTETSIACS